MKVRPSAISLGTLAIFGQILYSQHAVEACYDIDFENSEQFVMDNLLFFSNTSQERDFLTRVRPPDSRCPSWCRDASAGGRHSSWWNWGDATEWRDKSPCSSSNLHSSCTEWHSCSNEQIVSGRMGTSWSSPILNISIVCMRSLSRSFLFTCVFLPIFS